MVNLPSSTTPLVHLPVAHSPTTHSLWLKYRKFRYTDFDRRKSYEAFLFDKKFFEVENCQEYDLLQLRIVSRQRNFRKKAVYLILAIKLISSFVGFCGREVIDASVILATWKLKFVLIDLSDIIKLNHFAQFHRIRIV